MSKNKRWVIRHETHIIKAGETLSLCGLERDSMTAREESKRVMGNLNPRPEEEDFGCIKCLLLLNEEFDALNEEVTKINALLGEYTPEEMERMKRFSRAMIDGDLDAVIKVLNENLQSTEGDEPEQAARPARPDPSRRTGGKKGSKKGGAA